MPADATSGPFKIEGLGKVRTLSERLRFDVLPGPTITLFTPQSGPPGSEIVIEGDRLYSETKVFLDQVELRVTSREDGRVVARIPDSADAGDHHVRLEAGLSEARSQVTFRVIAPAEITAFSPERVDAGSKVVIRGRNFDMSTKVLWGSVVLRVVTVSKRGDSMTVYVPDTLVGARYLLVDSGGVRAQSRSMLEVLTPAPEIRPGNRKRR